MPPIKARFPPVQNSAHGSPYSSIRLATIGFAEAVARPSRTADPLLQLRDFPEVVSAEWQKGIQCRKRASAHRAAQAVKLIQRRADGSGIDRRVAVSFLDHRFLGFEDKPRLQLPIAADALDRLCIEPAGQCPDPFARRGRSASGQRARPRAVRGARRFRTVSDRCASLVPKLRTAISAMGAAIEAPSMAISGRSGN